ncbi:GNAT family N-acetyltransferase [Oscillospiraceae bacterium HV4-5-C5C]|nr:GNAT family N-acetyltransferase [Oscillospiraceae bacterium HV4-5-C5C]
MTVIRKATEQDVAAVALIYEHILSEEEVGRCTIGWQRGVYPTRETALRAVEQADLYVAEADATVVAAMRLNQEQVPEYQLCRWQYPAPDDQVMVMHTLVVDPQQAKRGYGRQMVDFYEQYAKARQCPYLRIDTNARNLRARSFYARQGYREAGIVPCTFNGIEGVSLVCIEKKLADESRLPGGQA